MTTQDAAAQLALYMLETFQEQSETKHGLVDASGFGSFEDDPTDTTLDGHFDLHAIAEAIIAKGYALHPPEGLALSKWQQYITLHGGPGDGVHLVLTDELVKRGVVRVPEQRKPAIVHDESMATRARIARYRRHTKYAGAAATCEVRAWTEWHFDGWEN